MSPWVDFREIKRQVVGPETGPLADCGRLGRLQMREPEAGQGTMLVDSHCHLDFPDFTAERDAVIARATAAGVGTIVTITTRLDHFAGVLAIAEAYPQIWCSVGAHPHEAADHAALVCEHGPAAIRQLDAWRIGWARHRCWIRSAPPSCMAWT